MGLQYLHNLYLRILEKILSRSWLLTRVYVKLFDEMTLKEFSNVPLKDRANILVIGCGSIPNTVITLSKSKNWKIVAVDRDADAVENARKVITRFGLKNVEIKIADGNDVDLKGYDLIVVALGTEPRKKILERISREADKKTYILYRNAGSFSKIFGEDGLDVDGLRIIRRYKRDDRIESVLMIKEEMV